MNVVLVNPPLVADAVYDPLRTTHPLGLWYIASHLRRGGHSCSIVDAVMEGSGQVALLGTDRSYRDFKSSALADFERLSPEAFVDRYSPFREDGRVERRLVRVGLTYSQLAERLDAFRPDVVGISFFASCNHVPGIESARAIRERFPSRAS